jgi:uncharacterized protein
MERVFADTGYWIALLNPRDDLHERASSISGNYSATQIVTSEMIDDYSLDTMDSE